MLFTRGPNRRPTWEADHVVPHAKSICQILNIRLHASRSTCADDHLSINADLLRQIWDGTHAEGSGTIRGFLPESLKEVDVPAKWQSTCASGGSDDEPVQVFTIVLNGDNHEALSPTTTSHGFTISFQPGPRPIVLRMSRDVIIPPLDEASIQSWISPAPEDRHTFSVEQHASLTTLENELQELHGLKHDVSELRHRIDDKKASVRRLLQQELKSFKSQLKECDSLRCIWNNVAIKVPHVAQSLASYFRRPVGEVHHHGPDCSKHPDLLHLHHKHPQQTETPHNPRQYDFPEPPVLSQKIIQDIDRDEMDHTDPNSPGALNGDAQSSLHDNPPSLLVHEEISPPPQNDDSAQHDFVSGPHEHDHAHDLARPVSSTAPPPHDHRHLPRVAGGVVFTAIFVAIFIALLRRRTCSPQRRAERAYRREERRRRWEYSRAACRHNFVKRWNRYLNLNAQDDYEEKQSQILRQEGVLEDAMQAEIRALQRAHEMVDKMVCGRERRHRLHRRLNAPNDHTITPAELEAGTSSTNYVTTVDSATNHPFQSRQYQQVTLITPSTISPDPSATDDEELPPPRYSQDLSGDIRVVDGFMYTPSATDATPDSSVVDCSPRLSFDTSSLRTRANSDVSKREMGFDRRSDDGSSTS